MFTEPDYVGYAESVSEKRRILDPNQVMKRGWRILQMWTSRMSTLTRAKKLVHSPWQFNQTEELVSGEWPMW